MHVEHSSIFKFPCDSFSYLNKVILADSIETESIRLTVSIEHDPSEQIPCSSQTSTRLPHQLQRGLILPDLMVIVVVSAKKQRVKPHLSEQSCLSGGVAKRIYLPRYGGAGLWSKVLLYELKTYILEGINKKLYRLFFSS